MAIADAVLHQLVQSTKCKTLFITHYPLVAASLEHRFPKDVENLHMDFESRSRIDGTREVTFLYRLVRGLVTGNLVSFCSKNSTRSTLAESFGIECGRLAGLPESILSVAANRAAIMKVEVQQRIKRNRYVAFLVLLSSEFLSLPRMRKIAFLLKQVLWDDPQRSTSAMMELKQDLDILRTLENDNLAY